MTSRYRTNARIDAITTDDEGVKLALKNLWFPKEYLALTVSGAPLEVHIGDVVAVELSVLEGSHDAQG